jgi:hypothetical protein
MLANNAMPDLTRAAGFMKMSRELNHASHEGKRNHPGTIS